jgi:hypothetical protein
MSMQKGEHGGQCNRTVCEVIPATYYNYSTTKYYCRSCAFDIQDFENTQKKSCNDILRVLEGANRMKNLILLILCVVLLGSCSVNVTPALISKANDVCEKNGGLKKIWISPVIATFTIYCNNGAKFDLDENTINKPLTDQKQ